MQDPGLAARELERCVKELKFCGALVNGFSQVADPGAALYYDTPDYWSFWETVERLDVPFYLHPRNPLPRWAGIYEGHSWLLGPTWGFGVEAATHALRLMGSGLFDRCPGLHVILGHLGEGLPYSLWRVDNRNNWAKAGHRCPAKKPIGDYFRANFHLTTAGNFRSQTLIDAMLEIGADRIMFSTDYPFEAVGDAAVWFDAAPISEGDRRKIGRQNAIRLFKLALKPRNRSPDGAQRNPGSVAPAFRYAPCGLQELRGRSPTPPSCRARSGGRCRAAWNPAARRRRGRPRCRD